MVSAAPCGQRRADGVVDGSRSRSGSAGSIFLCNGAAAGDPVELFEDEERSGLALICLVVVAAIAVAILGVGAQILG
jgi:preprotein translocase subunit Sec61beta